VWFAVAAAITAFVVAAGALLWDRGDDPSVRTAPAPATELPAPTVEPTTLTTPATTAPPAPATCPDVPAASMDSKSRTGHVAQSPGSGRLDSVRIQTSDCADEVAFTFGNGSPNWSVEYRTGPFTLDPSGQPVSVQGSAFLFVRFEHAEGVRSNDDAARDLLAGPLSHVTQVRQTQDFEGIVTWIIGLDAQLPFTAAERDAGQGGRTLAIELPERGDARGVTCTRPEQHLEFTVPVGWYAQLRDDVRCELVAPEPGSDRPVVVDVIPGTSIAALFGPTTPTTLTTADGRTASCVEGIYTGSSYFPAGQPGFVCSVNWGDGQNVTVTTNGYAGPRYAEYKAGVQAIVASARYLP